jgi:multiple sugar transport system permease protein
VVPPVASALLWIWLLNPQYGLINQALGAVGLPHPAWFYDPAWAKAGIILISIWGVGDVVIIYLGALQGVSQQLYEAAEVDGAGRWAKVRHVTLPMISPAILFNLITGAIGAFQYFTQAYVISEGTVGRGSGAVGGASGALLFYGIELYNEAFRYFDIGYASALAWVLLVIILITTAVLLRVSRSRVYYEEGR